MKILRLILRFLPLINISSACVRFAALWDANQGQRTIKGYLLDNDRKVCHLPFQKYENDRIDLNCRDGTRAWLVHNQIKNQFVMYYTYIDDYTTQRWIEFDFFVSWRLRNEANPNDQRFNLWTDSYGSNCPDLGPGMDEAIYDRAMD